MDAIILRDELRKNLERYAREQERSTSDVVNEAVRKYLLDADLEKIRREQAAYEAMHADLKETGSGKWVAVHEGQVVDRDDDDVALHRRVRDRYGDIAILLTRVDESPVREIRLRTPRTGPLRP